MGFWLGGLCLGMGGGILGGFMPYRHPVAVAISMLWWGIYFGCFGASIGALWGMWLKCRQPGAALNAIAPVVGASIVVHNGENGNSRRIHPIEPIVGEMANHPSSHVSSRDRTNFRMDPNFID
jgi:hypothetical protein